MVKRERDEEGSCVADGSPLAKRPKMLPHVYKYYWPVPNRSAPIEFTCCENGGWMLSVPPHKLYEPLREDMAPKRRLIPGLLAKLNQNPVENAILNGFCRRFDLLASALNVMLYSPSDETKPLEMQAACGLMDLKKQRV